MAYSLYTDKGLQREQNEDSCFATQNDKMFFGLVCDGMGGENAGDVASSLASQFISAEILEKYRHEMTVNELKNIMISAVSLANSIVYDKSVKQPEMQGMGTTVVAAIVKDSVAVIVHAGDSRAYLVGKDGISPVTTDHSLVSEMFSAGLITAEEAENHPDKNLITRAVGVQSFIDTEFTQTVIAPGQTLLLCSDGLSNFVSENEISEIINNNDIKTACRELINRANENGGGDNITAVLYCADEGDTNNG